MRGGGDYAVGAEATAQLGPSQGSFSERAVPLRRGNRHLRLSERAAAEAPVHQQGARHDVDTRRQSRGLPGLLFTQSRSFAQLVPG